jgi:metal-sulfur cluster biosynthetic enzyme
MQFNFGNFTATISGASVVIDTALVGKGDVKMTFDPPWGMDMMSDEARLELGFM